MPESSLRVGSRGSALALAQTELACAALRRIAPGTRVEVVTMTTKGDRMKDVPFGEIGPKGVFARELQSALRSGALDIAVHSLKDLEASEPEGLQIAAVVERGEVRDALVSREGLGLNDLRPGSRVGTSSLRRSAQLAMLRPDLDIAPLRGNVDTRLEKVARGDVDAAVLAGAGIVRLGRPGAVTEWLDPERFLPAPGQGAIAIETRSGELGWVREAEDADTRAAVDAERAFMDAMEGGCRVPLAAWGRVHEGGLVLDGFVALPDGSRSVRARVGGSPADAQRLGAELAESMRALGAGDLLARLCE